MPAVAFIRESQATVSSTRTEVVPTAIKRRPSFFVWFIIRAFSSLMLNRS